MQVFINLLIYITVLFIIFPLCVYILFGNKKESFLKSMRKIYCVLYMGDL